jgi:hypothetical protein
MAPAAKEFYEDQKNLNKLCNFLRSSDGPAVREAIMMDKRVYYIKGKKFMCVCVFFVCTKKRPLTQ